MDSYGKRTSDSGEHEYYEELCAIATSGSLTDREWLELKEHTGQCETCASLLRQYRSLTKVAMPVVIAGDECAIRAAQPGWSLQAAKQELLGRIARGETSASAHASVPVPSASMPLNWRRWWHILIPRPQVAFAYAGAAMLVVAVGIFGYYAGKRASDNPQRVAIAPAAVTSLQAQLERLTQERNSLDRAIQAKTEEISRLTQDLQRQSAAAAQFSALHQQYQQQVQQQGAVIADLNRQTVSLATERDGIKRRLEEAENALLPVQRKLESLQQERNRDLLRVASLETRIEDLSSRLKEDDESLRRQEQFLASDRDIRELMGARDLYIADVFDVDRAGKTQKAFGRVFYTSGKSLIFYAFDLDKTPGVRDASFQAWGRRGPGDKRPLNMGVFYLDNEANKRWVLRFEDPKLLVQVDAVFVTVEPHGGRQKPGGRQLLFASLRTPPNHP